MIYDRYTYQWIGGNKMRRRAPYFMVFIELFPPDFSTNPLKRTGLYMVADVHGVKIHGAFQWGPPVIQIVSGMVHEASSQKMGYPF